MSAESRNHNKKTLAGDLKVIESAPDYTQLDKLRTYRNISHHWSETSLLANKILSNHTTPSSEVEKFAKRIGGWMAFVPNYLSHETKMDIEELGKIVEGIHADSNSNLNSLLINPIGTGAIVSMAYIAGVLGMNYLLNIESTSATYLSKEMVAVGGAVHGAVIGGLGSLLKLYQISQVRESGNYLESKLKEIGKI